jgi:DnaJ-class molecular chaperone
MNDNDKKTLEVCPVCKGEGEIIQITRNRKKVAVKLKCRHCDGEGKRKEQS